MRGRTTTVNDLDQAFVVTRIKAIELPGGGLMLELALAPAAGKRHRRRRRRRGDAPARSEQLLDTARRAIALSAAECARPSARSIALAPTANLGHGKSLPG